MWDTLPIPYSIPISSSANNFTLYSFPDAGSTTVASPPSCSCPCASQWPSTSSSSATSCESSSSSSAPRRATPTHDPPAKSSRDSARPCFFFHCWGCITASRRSDPSRDTRWNLPMSIPSQLVLPFRCWTLMWHSTLWHMSLYRMSLYIFSFTGLY